MLILFSILSFTIVNGKFHIAYVKTFDKSIIVQTENQLAFTRIVAIVS